MMAVVVVVVLMLMMVMLAAARRENAMQIILPHAVFYCAKSSYPLCVKIQLVSHRIKSAATAFHTVQH